ncbi:helix-turn-helix transcriptional regulator [Clostridium botulinum]|uniref:helix-turn-helix transcriptional regulator n=1 Tax=Clostridium botulinum TaxID=1491 RepID=UPI003A8021DC
MIHKNLKQIREEHNLTQDEMTKLLGLKHKSHYNQIENGKISMSLDMAKKISCIFNTSVDEIFFQEEVHAKRTNNTA